MLLVLLARLCNLQLRMKTSQTNPDEGPSTEIIARCLQHAKAPVKTVPDQRVEADLPCECTV